MSKRILLVFDKSEGLIEKLHKLSPESNEEWELLPLLHEKTSVKEIESYLKSQGCAVETIQLQEDISKTSFLLRDKYIHFIYEVGEKNITNGRTVKTLFKYPFSHYFLWWPSLVAERNTVKSTAFYDLIKVYSLVHQIKKRQAKEVLLYLSNKAVLSALMEWQKGKEVKIKSLKTTFQVPKGVLYHYIRAIRSFLLYINRTKRIKLGMYRSFKQRWQRLRKLDYLILTYFPLVDRTAIKKKYFINKFFQPIQNSLKKKEIKYAWAAFFIPYDDYKLKDGITQGRDINTWNELLFFWEELLKARHLLSSFFIFHWFAVKYFFLRKKLKRQFIFEADGIKIDSWPIFKNECDDSFCGSVLFFNLLYFTIFNRLFKHIDKETKILYPAEMQNWEKALCAASSETGRTKTVAIQHTTTPIFSLKYFQDKNEIRTKYEDGGMPKPFKFACVGDIPEKLLKESGWNKNSLFVLGGIRFQHYLDLIDTKIDWAEKKNKIIVALPIHPEEAKEVINMCLEAFQDEKDISVVFKGHPSNPVLPLLDSLKIKSLNFPFTVSDEPLSKLLPETKIIIVTESSATLEGLACLCQVVIPKLVNAIDLNPLTGLSDLPLYANSPEELGNIGRDIMKKETPPYSREKGIQFLEQYITFRDKDEDYFECIEAQFP